MSRPETCGRCGQEVRFGVRPSPARPPADRDASYWMHRDVADDLDHEVAFGKTWTPELQATLDASLAAMAARGSADTRKKQEQEDVAAKDEWAEVPAPELYSRPADVNDFPPRSGIRTMFNLIGKAQGWEVRRFTIARGPYVGARGQVLSISDSVVMGMRGPTLDTGHQVAVASWRDGSFDFAYTGILRGNTVSTTPANAKALKAFIRGE